MFVRSARTTGGVPVLVLGQGMTALAVIRCLGRARIPLCVASETSGYVMRSRWYRGVPDPLPESSDPQQLADRLAALELERAVLMPCTDRWASAASALPADTAARFPSSLASADVVRRFTDKERFAALLAELAVPCPRTVSVADGTDLDGVPDDLLEDALLKPVDSQAFGERFGAKAVRVRSRGQARQWFERGRGIGLRLVLQEYIPGPPTAHYLVDGFVDRHGRSCARVVSRRLRMHPPELANSSAKITVPAAEAGPGVAAIDRLLRAVAFRGVFNAELKWDARDETFKVIEINVRMHTWLDFEASSGGPNMPEMAYRDALQMPIDSGPECAIGRRAIWLPHDYDACRRLFRAGELSFGGWLRAWCGASFLNVNLADPVPSLVELRDVWRERSLAQAGLPPRAGDA